MTGSPTGNRQTGTCWIAATPNGQYLFAVDTGTNTISRYSVATNGSLTLLGNTPISTPSGLATIGAVDAAVDPSGSFLYVAETRQAAVGIFKVNNGNLSELPSSPVSVPAQTAPSGIAVD